MWHGHLGVGLIDCQAQRAPTLIGQRWSTISASTRYPRLNPLWLVTHCTLSHAHHSFQSHVYHLACMEMAKFLCAIFNWLKLFYCNGVTSPKPSSQSKFLWCCFFAQMAKNRENNSIICWDKAGYHYRDCKCGWPFRTASEIGRSPHLVAVTWKYKKLI